MAKSFLTYLLTIVIVAAMIATFMVSMWVDYDRTCYKQGGEIKDHVCTVEIK